MEDMKDRLTRQLMKHEDIRKKPYTCTAGKLTIGIGRNLTDRGLTTEECMYLFENDLKIATRDLVSVFGNIGYFSTMRQVALIDMMFNLGKPRFLGFKKMIAAIKEADWKEAANQAKDSRWYSQVGERGERLVGQIRRG